MALPPLRHLNYPLTGTQFTNKHVKTCAGTARGRDAMRSKYLLEVVQRFWKITTAPLLILYAIADRAAVIQYIAEQTKENSLLRGILNHMEILPRWATPLAGLTGLGLLVWNIVELRKSRLVRSASPVSELPPPDENIRLADACGLLYQESLISNELEIVRGLVENAPHTGSQTQAEARMDYLALYIISTGAALFGRRSPAPDLLNIHLNVEGRGSAFTFRNNASELWIGKSREPQFTDLHVKRSDALEAIAKLKKLERNAHTSLSRIYTRNVIQR